MKFIALCFLCMSIAAKIQEATDSLYVNNFMEKNKDQMISLLFYDSQKGSGQGILGKISNLFTTQKDDDSLEEQIAENTAALKIDTSNPLLSGVREGHGATEIPFLVVYTPDHKIGYRGPPNEESIIIIQELYTKTYLGVEKRI